MATRSRKKQTGKGESSKSVRRQFVSLLRRDSPSRHLRHEHCAYDPEVSPGVVN
jgi:hypothetical protein